VWFTVYTAHLHVFMSVCHFTIDDGDAVSSDGLPAADLSASDDLKSSAQSAQTNVS